MVTRVALVGLSGAGKSAVAPLLAARLGLESVDLDREIERAEGTSVAAIIDSRGEDVFRELEARALAAAIEEAAVDAPPAAGRPVPGRVLACGAGVLARAENRELLKRRACVIWLEVDPEIAAARLGDSARARPLLRGGATAGRLRSMLEARAAAYAEAADLVVETGGRTVEGVVGAIVPLWEAFRRRWVTSGS